MAIEFEVSDLIPASPEVIYNACSIPRLTVI
jgi:hypothetical protein